MQVFEYAASAKEAHKLSCNLVPCACYGMESLFSIGSHMLCMICDVGVVIRLCDTRERHIMQTSAPKLAKQSGYRGIQVSLRVHLWRKTVAKPSAWQFRGLCVYRGCS